MWGKRATANDATKAGEGPPDQSESTAHSSHSRSSSRGGGGVGKGVDEERDKSTAVGAGNGTDGVDGAAVSSSDSSSGGSKPASLSKLLGLARPEMPMLLVALVLMIMAEGSGLLTPLLVARAYDALVNANLSAGERRSDINHTMVAVLAIHLAATAIGFGRTAIMGVAGERIVARTRNRLYDSILRQDVAFFDATKTGELVSRLGSDAALLQQGTSQALPEVAVGLVKILVSIAIMFWISPPLAGLMIGLVVIILAVCVPFGKTLGTLSKTYQDVLGAAQNCSTEALGAIRTVQSFAAEDRERDRYRRVIGEPDKYRYWWPANRTTHRTTYSIGFFKAVAMVGLFTVIFGLGFAGMYICLWFGFKLVVDEVITLGQLTAFQSYIFQIGGALGQTSQFVSKLIEAKGAAARLFYLLERVPAIPTPRDDDSKNKMGAVHNDDGDNERAEPVQRPSTMVGNVDFNSVCFSYPSRPNVNVLRDFSLTIPANQTAALVGASGAGSFERLDVVSRARIIFAT